MKKIFCDCCGAEITRKNGIADLIDATIEINVPATAYTAGGKGSAFVTRRTCHGDELDAFDFCKYCVLDAIARRDDRPQDRQATIDDATLAQLANKIEGRLHEGGAPSLRRWQAFVEFRREHNV